MSYELEEDIKEYCRKRDAVLTALDDDAYVALGIEYKFPVSGNKYTRLVAMHKARVAAFDIPLELRAESIKWLKDRGYKFWE